MPRERIHRAVAADGTAIAARVHGQGPPLVLVHGGLGDGEVGWRSLLWHLTDQFTCFAMSTRGRGLSDDHPDHTLEALVSDVVAVAEAVGEPVGLMGWSLGATAALGAAATSRAASAVAVYEPGVFDVPNDANPVDATETARIFTEAVAAGRLADAARSLIERVATPQELAALAKEGAFAAWAANMPVATVEVPAVQEGLARGGMSPTAPSVLANVTAPVLYLHGSRTPTSWYVDGAHHVARHAAADVQIVEIADAGHFAPILAPTPIARELARFFTAEPQPA